MKEEARSGVAATALIGLIRLYQLTLSAVMGRRCRFLPTCSDYAMEAIGRHGAWHGMGLGIRRVLRCHPWGGHGFDPVPDELASDKGAGRRNRAADAPTMGPRKP